MTGPSARVEPAPLDDASRVRLNVAAEMDALGRIVSAFEELGPDARARTLRYLADRYGQRPMRPGLIAPPAARRPSEVDRSDWPR